MFSRRGFLVGGIALFGASSGLAAQYPSPVEAITALEKQHGGRLGVAVLDTGTGRRMSHRAEERFAMCSTFKFILAAAVLHRIDAGLEQPDRIISYSKSGLLPVSPVTEKHVGEGGLPVITLCEAAVTVSDNTGANLLIASLGGPQGVTRFARGIGDKATRLDNKEIALNDVKPGETHDTTTPDAMLANMQALLTGKVLSSASRELFTSWLKACQTGLQRIRAGIPADWQAGDKTGTWDGENNETNDIAILWPPARKPILVSAYYAGSKAAFVEREAVLAEVGRIVARRFV